MSLAQILTENDNNPTTIENTGIYYTHPGQDFNHVAEDVLSAFPEDTFFFLDEGALVQRARHIDGAFLPDNPNKGTAYAVKANSRRRVVELMIEAGITHFDCASPREIELVRSLLPEATILFNHPVKRRKDIKAALNAGVNHFTAQTLHEVDKILSKCDESDLTNPPEITIRFKTMNEHAEINLSQMFGAEEEKVRDLLGYITQFTHAEPGISFHTGSQNLNPQTFATAIHRAAAIVRGTGRVGTLNLGGGLPADYRGTKPRDLQEFFKQINAAVTAVAPDILTSGKHKILIEPGRAMIAESVRLAVSITSREKRDGEDCIYMHDGRYTSFSKGDHPNSDARLSVLRMTDQGLIELPDNPSKEFVVFGNTCDSYDTLNKRTLPKSTRAGDWILHKAAGAYSDVYATDFINIERPKWIAFNPIS